MRRWPAERRRAGLAAGLATVGLAILGWSCAGGPAPEPQAPSEPGRPAPPPTGARRGAPANATAPLPIREVITFEPLIRVGIDVGGESAVIMSTAGLSVRDGATGEELVVAGEEIVRFELADGGVSPVEPAGRSPGARRILVEPLDPVAELLIDGSSYRGSAELVADPSRGLVVVNRLGLEAYLLGVVPAEIGRRAPEELAAVRAQAVAARTYTIASLGRRDSLGFDVFATVEDQVYGGVAAERAEVTRAIRDTWGEVLTFADQPVLALYHSTCGGRTATREEVWGEPDLPYLRSVRDAGGSDDFCSISPRYRWRESWTAEALDGWVREELAARLGVAPRSIGRILGIRVLSRTVDDRVDELEVEASGGKYVVRKNEIRFVLRPAEGRILGSTDFVVRQGRADAGAVVVEGRGFGHGIGMCQWGAIGRARAGHGYREILAAYYRGAAVQKLY